MDIFPIFGFGSIFKSPSKKLDNFVCPLAVAFIQFTTGLFGNGKFKLKLLTGNVQVFS